nr:Pheromone-binding protein-related protein 2 [Metisa plana]
MRELLGFIVLLLNNMGVESQQDESRWFLEKVIECAVQENVTRQQTIDIMYNEEPYEPNTKCYLSCLYKKFEIMGDDGKFIKTGYEDHMSFVNDNEEKMVQKAEYISAACEKVNSEPVSDSDGCDRAVLIQQCVINETLKGPDKFDFERIAELCMEEHSITLEQLAQLMNDRLPLDRPNKCFIKCILENYTILGTDKFFNTTAWEEYVDYMYEDEPEERSAQLGIGNKCSSENGEEMHDNGEACSRATLIVRCIRRRGIEQDRFDYHEHVMECAIRFDATYEDVELVVEDDIFDGHPFRVKCFMSCVIQKYDVFSKTGDIKKGPFEEVLALRAVFDDQIEWEKKIYNNCQRINERDGDDYGCEKGYSIIKCFAEEKNFVGIPYHGL